MKRLLVPLALLLWTSLAAADAPSEASRLRILLVVDTLGFNATGNGFPVDKDQMKKAIKEALREQNLEDRYTLDILHGADATPAKVLDHYHNLTVEPTEALVCYYSGHGGSDRETGHFLDMKSGRLERSALRKAMEAKKPRLLVLLTDCCADYEGPLALHANPFPGKSKGKPAPKTFNPALDGGRQNTVRTVRGDALVHLLFRHEGLVDITACDIGKLAFSSKNRGGYFTIALTGLLGAHCDRFDCGPDGMIAWAAFFKVLQTGTQHAARGDSYHQTPAAFTLPPARGK